MTHLISYIEKIKRGGKAYLASSDPAYVDQKDEGQGVEELYLKLASYVQHLPDARLEYIVHTDHEFGDSRRVSGGHPSLPLIYQVKNGSRIGQSCVKVSRNIDKVENQSLRE